MTETQGTAPVWGAGEPLVTATAQPDWETLAERHAQEARRRKQIRAVAAGVVATAAIGGVVATVIQLAGPGHQSDHTAATAVTGGSSASAGPDGTVSDISPGGGASGYADAPASPSADAPPLAQPSARTPSSADPVRSTAAASATPVGPPPSSAPAGSVTPGSRNPAPSPAATPNPYSPGQVCGSGYSVIDSHNLDGATVYLLYSNATGNDCVLTLAANVGAAVPMNATLSVQGGASASNPGSYTDYAGPVVEHAPKVCVQWGGSYQGTTWTSGWSHCG